MTQKPNTETNNAGQPELSSSDLLDDIIRMLNEGAKISALSGRKVEILPSGQITGLFIEGSGAGISIDIPLSI